MKAVLLQRYPEGAPAAADFALADLPDPALGAGQVLVQLLYLSLDPLPRVRMQALPPFGPPMVLGAPVEGRGVGRVLASRAAGFAAGDLVVGELGWRTRAVLPAAALQRVEGEPAHAHLNALGSTGLTAWFVAERIAPKDGEIVLVAPAAGAVGSLLCQLLRARAPGARIVGGVVGAAQADFLRAFGFEAFDCTAADWPALAVDALVDGVGGAFHDRAMGQLNPRGRVLLLGFVSGYGEGPPRYGNAGAVLMKRATMEGFLLADHMDRASDARASLAAMLADGSLRPAETIHRGLAAAPAAFAALFADSPPGKQIVEVETD